MTDPVDEAIAAAAQPQQIPAATLNTRFDVSGRPFLVTVPVDLTHAEALELCGRISVMPAELAKRVPQGPRIVVPTVLVGKA